MMTMINKKESFNKGVNSADNISDKFIWFIRIGLISFIIVLCVIISSLKPTQALSTSTYYDLSSQSSQVYLLTSLLPNNFYGDYVVFRSGEYDYYIFYGDLSLSNNNAHIIGENLNYIKYYRTGSGYSYSYSYEYGTDDLDLTLNNVVTSNLNFELSSQYYEFNTQIYEYKLLTIVIIFFIIMSTLSCLSIVKRKLV